LHARLGDHNPNCKQSARNPTTLRNLENVPLLSTGPAKPFC